MNFKFIAYTAFIYFSTTVIASNTDISQLNDLTATGSMAEIQKKNVYGHEQYSLAAIQLSKDSMIRFSNGSDCQASCPLGCCDDVDGLMTESRLLSMLSQGANIQASEHRTSALQACLNFNKLSSLQKNCASEISTLIQFSPQVSWYDNSGKCTSSAPKECTLMEGLGASPYQIINRGSDTKGSQNTIKKFFENSKINTDGYLTIKTPTGTKKILLSDFQDSKKLIQSGLSANTAKMWVQKISKYSAFLKSKIQSESTTEPTMTANSVTENSEPPSTTADSSSAPIDSEAHHQHNPDFDASLRLPITAELQRKLNGDPIGRYDENIFKMIQRRYLVNDKNDFFN